MTTEPFPVLFLHGYNEDTEKKTCSKKTGQEVQMIWQWGWGTPYTQRWCCQVSKTAEKTSNQRHDRTQIQIHYGTATSEIQRRRREHCIKIQNQASYWWHPQRLPGSFHQKPKCWIKLFMLAESRMATTVPTCCHAPHSAVISRDLIPYLYG